METERIQKRKGISGNVLKMIAVITMMIDHIGAAILEIGVLHFPDYEAAQAIVNTMPGYYAYLADRIMRTIGRPAFPIFCFLLVEGFVHTRDVRKYAGRLLIFALLSEIPFDLALWNSWFYPFYQNVYFTLLIGLLVLAGYKRYNGRPVVQACVALAGCVAAIILKCDYNVIGIAMILSFYVFRTSRLWQNVFSGIIAGVESLGNFAAGALALIPINLYNGTRGRINLKYFFYWFYPVHLALLYIIRLLFM